MIPSIKELAGDQAMTIVYNDTVEDLRATILSKFDSLAHFARISGLDRFNLSRLFSKENPREMSIGTFVTICEHVGLMKANSVPLEMTRSKMSLKQYLETDNNAIMRNILLIRFA